MKSRFTLPIALLATMLSTQVLAQAPAADEGTKVEDCTAETVPDLVSAAKDLDMDVFGAAQSVEVVRLRGCDAAAFQDFPGLASLQTAMEVNTSLKAALESEGAAGADVVAVKMEGDTAVLYLLDKENA